jgi:DNA polymerase-3 subunit epsilon
MNAWRRWRYRARVAGTPLQALYATPLPPLARALRDSELLALDFETTGLDPARDRILSIGWVLLAGGRIRMRESGHLLVNSGGSVGHSATIHGLVDADLAAGVSLPVAVETLLQLLAGRTLLAHCAVIESSFLERACRALYAAPPLLQVVDTLAIEAQLRSNERLAEGALRLHACRERYQLPRYRGHHAAIDALACAELLLAQASRIRRGDGPTLGELVRLSR